MTFYKNLQYALSDYRKNIIYILFVNILLVSCFLFVFFFYAGQIDIFKIFRVIETRDRIQGENVHFLNAFPNLDNPDWTKSKDNSDQLGSIFEDDDYIIVSSSEPLKFLHNINFPIDIEETYTEPIILLGSKVDSAVGTDFQYEPENSLLKINARAVEAIPDSTFIISKDGVIDLDNKKLLILNTEDFMRHLRDPFLYWNNMRTADNLSHEMLVELCNDLVRNELCTYAFPVVPSEVLRDIESNTIGETIAIIFILVYITIIFFGLNIFLREVINNSMRTYAVHQIVGSSIKDLRLRLLLFLLLIMLLPLIILAFLILPMMGVDNFNPLPIFIFYLVFCILIYLVNRGQININRLNKVIRNFSQ